MKTIKFKIVVSKRGSLLFGVYSNVTPFAIVKDAKSEEQALEYLRKELKTGEDWDFIEDVKFIEVKTECSTYKGSLKAFLDSLEFDQQTEVVEKRPTFESELAGLLNLYAIDSECNTPDYVLARFVKEMLQTYAKSVTLRDKDETVKMLRKRNDSE